LSWMAREMVISKEWKDSMDYNQLGQDIFMAITQEYYLQVRTEIKCR